MGEMPRLSSMDLQLAVLQQLPSPILVLSSLRTAVYANHAAQRLLCIPDSIQQPRIRGRCLDELGIKLMYNRVWDVILDTLLADYNRAIENGPVSPGLENETLVHEMDIKVLSPENEFGHKSSKAFISILTVETGNHFILSFEDSASVEKAPAQASYLPGGRPPPTPASSMERVPQTTEASDFPDENYPSRDTFIPNGMPPMSPPVSEYSEYSEDPKILSSFDIPPDTTAETSKMISKLKTSIFDSCDVAGFILSEDEQFYLTNKKLRQQLGDVMGGARGCGGSSLRGRLEVWDEYFTRKLQPAEYPGVRLVRAPRTTFQNYRCGFVHAITGEKVVMNVSGEFLYDDTTGEFVGGICWCRELQDYSDFVRDQQERDLLSHKTICNSMPHMVFTTRTDGACDWFSDQWYDWTGLTPEESLGMGYARAIHNEDLPRILANWDKHSKTRTECSTEVRYRRYDGLYKWALLRTMPYVDQDKKIIKWYGTVTLIHELVMDRIRETEKKQQAFTVLAHAEVNLFAINLKRKITLSEGKMLGQSESGKVYLGPELIGQDCIEIAQNTQKGGIPEYQKNILDILAGRKQKAISEDVVGNKTYRTRMIAELEPDPDDGAGAYQIKGVLGLSIDITDMKQRAALELDNARLMVQEQAAKDSNRMKSQFLANMSHEMRTPTAGVVGIVELLSDDPSLSQEQRDYVDTIKLSAKALLSIVNDILDFSKIESGRLDIEEVPFNLSTTIEEIWKLLSMFAQQKNVDFTLENTMDENLEVIGDPGRVKQVLSNLMTNALKFTKEGSVKIKVTSSVILSNATAEENIEVQFDIEDTGIGIEKSVLDKLFQPFSQGDASTARLYGGTGLGLTISRNLSNLMRGTISLESTAGIGTKATFKVPFKVHSHIRTLPVPDPKPSTLEIRHHNLLAEDEKWTQPRLVRPKITRDPPKKEITSIVSSIIPTPEETTEVKELTIPKSPKPLDVPKEPKQATKPPLDTSGKPKLSSEQRKNTHVLVVEDNPINQKIALKNIRKLGFPVSAVWNGREALTYLTVPSPTQPRPEIILMDCQMPVMDGYEATKALRAEAGEELRQIPVIAMTASAIQGDREKCYTAGMDDYLAKPVEKGRLEEMLLKWAMRKRGGVCAA